MTKASGGRSPRRRLGDAAEQAVATRLTQLGWGILGRSVQVGRDELDLVAVEPGRPPMLVFVEVRSHTVSRFGSPEESVGKDKVARLYRAAAALLRAGELPDGTAVPRLAWRVDLVSVQVGPATAGRPGDWTFRHLRGLSAP